MHTQDEQTAAEQLLDYMKDPDVDTALNMIRLAKYVAERGHMAAVCTEGDSACVIYYHATGGWWKI